MRKINIANEKRRDAQVGFELNRPPKIFHYRTPAGKDVASKRYLRYSSEVTPEKLLDLPDLENALLQQDPEVEMELAGKELEDLSRVYTAADGGIIYTAQLMEKIFAPDGSEKERRPAVTQFANIADEDVPLLWTGKQFPKKQALRKFVFSRTYQLRHVNGLTFDFLYEMAKKLSESNTLMLIGSGPKGNAPLVISNNGTPYRGFLEGRIQGERFCLLLHLTNLELKGI